MRLRTRRLRQYVDNLRSLLSIPIPPLNTTIPSTYLLVYCCILSRFQFDRSNSPILRQTAAIDDAGIITTVHGDPWTPEDPQDRRLTLAFTNFKRKCKPRNFLIMPGLGNKLPGQLPRSRHLLFQLPRRSNATDAILGCRPCTRP